jgi:hypothetical protein
MILLVILLRSRITWISLPRTTHETIALMLACLVEEAIVVVVVVEDRTILLLLYTPQPEFQLEPLHLSPLFQHPADSLIHPFALLLPKSKPDFTRKNNISIIRNKDILAETTPSPIT